MQSSRYVVFRSFASQAFDSGFRLQGDLNLGFETYWSHLVFVVSRYVADDAPESTLDGFIKKLHTNDLYLSIACAEHSNSAWRRFSSLYKTCISNSASFACRNRGDADDLADGILGYLCLPDSAGRCRMASYHGLSSLGTWLGSILNHRAIKEQRRKSDRFDQLDHSTEVADYDVMSRLERDIRIRTYAPLLKNSFNRAMESLTERERFILSLRYYEDVSCAEIARDMQVYPSTIARQLESIREKLRRQMRSVLATEHFLNQHVIDECLGSIAEYWRYA